MSLNKSRTMDSSGALDLYEPSINLRHMQVAMMQQRSFSPLFLLLKHWEGPGVGVRVGRCQGLLIY
jgi:hypothetical protein